LSGIFTKIRFIDKNAYLTKLKGDNPCSTADISLLKGWNKQIKARIKPEVEEVIIKALKEFENREMLLIFALAMTTGMRRSELLSLKWSQINFSENKIDLSRTKNGNSREVVLNDDAKEVIRAIPKKTTIYFTTQSTGTIRIGKKLKSVVVLNK
jgi:integrase